MLEDYLKRLELLITPSNYNKKNFREKLIVDLEDKKQEKAIQANSNGMNNINGNNMSIPQGESESNNEISNQNNDEGSKKLIDVYLGKMGIKDQKDSLDMIDVTKNKLYKKILENEGKLESPEDGKIYSPKSSNNHLNDNTSHRDQTFSPGRKSKAELTDADIPNLCEKIHNLNCKNMSYRYEIEQLKKKISESTQINSEQTELISKLEVEKESNNQYLIKLENMLTNNSSSYRQMNCSSTSLNQMNSSQLNQNENINNFSIYDKNFVVEINKSNSITIEDRLNKSTFSISDKKELKDFILFILAENKKLKQFQSQVFEISKNYDSINDIMLESMKSIQKSVDACKMKNSEKYKPEITANFELFITNVEKTLEVKQNEYNFLLDSKDQEIKFLQEEIIKLNNEMETVKRDRIKDQKILADYESQIKLIQSKLAQNTTGIKVKVNMAENAKEDSKFEKKIEPAQKSVDKIIKKIEKTFDLQDPTNIKMLSSLTKINK